MRFRKIEAYLILGMYLAVGLLLGYSIGKEKPVIKPNTVTVDVVKDGDEILIYEHYTGDLIFEYNKNKEVDKTAYREFEEVWEEIKSY
jgi:glycine betaine/choline ABC-type transport system substrate-binding protein